MAAPVDDKSDVDPGGISSPGWVIMRELKQHPSAIKPDLHRDVLNFVHYRSHEFHCMTYLGKICPGKEPERVGDKLRGEVYRRRN